MSIRIDETWIENVCRHCDPVFEAADVGFVRQVQRSSAGIALLWEAKPALFIARYPDSHIVESYGGQEQWSRVPCVDYWIYIDDGTSEARLSLDGWPPKDPIPLTGNGEHDGQVIGTVLAEVLRVRPPTS